MNANTMMVTTIRNNDGIVEGTTVSPLSEVISALYAYGAGAAVLTLQATGALKSFPILGGQYRATVEPSSRPE